MAEVDRDAWARTVRHLMDTETKGNASELARRVGVTTKTLYRWLGAEVAVSEESVRKVTRSLNYTPAQTIQLLLALGYYRADEFPPAAPEPEDSGDPEEQIIRDAGLSPSATRNLIKRLRQMRERDAQRRAEDLANLIEAYRRTA